MKQLSFLSLLVLPLCGISQQGISSTGGNVTNSTGSVSNTVGQPVYLSATASNGDQNQGMQQPYEFLVMSVEALQAGQEIELFPNPTADLVNLKMAGFGTGMQVRLYDQNGKLLQQLSLNASEAQISMANYANGTYRLVLQQNNRNLKTYQIIKNH